MIFVMGLVLQLPKYSPAKFPTTRPFWLLQCLQLQWWYCTGRDKGYSGNLCYDACPRLGLQPLHGIHHRDCKCFESPQLLNRHQCTIHLCGENMGKEWDKAAWCEEWEALRLDHFHGRCSAHNGHVLDSNGPPGWCMQATVGVEGGAVVRPTRHIQW